MIEESPYIKEIKELILSKNELGISEIISLKTVKGLNFNKDEYSFIIEQIKQRKIEDIKRLPDVREKAFADVTIFEFYDQNSRHYIATVYDSDELWQDPEILDIFPQ